MQALNPDHPVMISCGQCMRCRLAKAYEWSARCMHESSLYADNIFITLTYAPEHMPSNSSLRHTDFQKFMKRLRKFSVKSRLRSLRYYMCGEYGETRFRPHYHALLFDFKFPDQKRQLVSGSDYPHYKSDILEGLWPLGNVDIGSVTQDSASYVASYCTKIIKGDAAEAHYRGRAPEYSRMSNGVGLKWLEQFHADVYRHDAVVMRGGAKMRPSRYYDSKYELLYPAEAAVVKEKRLRHKQKRDEGFLAFCTREEITRAQLAQKKGTL